DDPRRVDGIVDAHEPVPEGDLGRFVRRARVNRLREGLVDAGDENHELGIFGRELVVRDAVERAGFVDRMYDGPAEREEGDARAFQPELVVAAGRTFDAAEQ